MVKPMNAHTPKSDITNKSSDLTRRSFVVGAAAVGTSLLVGCSQADILSTGSSVKVGAFGPFIKFSPDGMVTIVSKHLEMGQGNHAGLAAIVAEELDADWSKIVIEQAPANAKIYGNGALNNLQGTGGSTAIANSWLQLRKAGAGARAMMVDAAAKTWGVSAAEISVADGVVSHPSGKTAGFGELIAAASLIKPPADPKLKSPADFKLIGTDKVRRKDSKAKSDGTARFTQDVHLPNMLVAVVAHAPRFGAKVKSYDATAALKIPGVDRVVQVSTGVAVLASNTFAAKTGRDALNVTWDFSKAEQRSSEDLLTEYKRIASGGVAEIKPQPFEMKGDVSKVNGETLSVTYDFPYLAHATMEPMNCVAMVDGRSCKLIGGSQIQTLDQLNAAMVVYSLPGAVEIETLFAGGSFGRRGNPPSDYVVECVEIAKQVGSNRPVKLVWTREDDMMAGRYRPMAHHAIDVKIGPDGYPLAWRHRIVTQSIMKGVPGAPAFDNTTVEGAMGSPYLKAIPNVDAQVYMPENGVTVLWFRSVGATHTAMAMEHTIDQLAARAKIDPVDYRRALYAKAGKDGERHLAALNLAVAKANYAGPIEPGFARGVAVHESFGSVVAQIAEVSLVNGQPKVHRVVSAVDCGIAVAPNQIAAQIEGATCYGLSAALFGKITIRNGAPVETNFDGYRVLRMDEAPLVETHIVPSGEAPSGVGEPGTPLIAPAVANALLVLSGKATTALPFVSA